RRSQPPDVSTLAPEAPRPVEAELKAGGVLRRLQHGPAYLSHARRRLLAQEGQGQVQILAAGVICRPGLSAQALPRRLKGVQLRIVEVYRYEQSHLMPPFHRRREGPAPRRIV